MKVQFYGASDDLIEVSVDHRCEEICDSGDYLKSIVVQKIRGARAVTVHPVYDGCWAFAVGLSDEGAPLPPWTFSIERKHGYSVNLIIDTGDDVVTVERDKEMIL